MPLLLLCPLCLRCAAVNGVTLCIMSFASLARRASYSSLPSQIMSLGRGVTLMAGEDDDVDDVARAALSQFRESST